MKGFDDKGDSGNIQKEALMWFQSFQVRKPENNLTTEGCGETGKEGKCQGGVRCMCKKRAFHLRSFPMLFVRAVKK